MHFTATLLIPATSTLLKTCSINGNPPTDPLNPINPDNACTLRITAAAGTELAGAYSYSTFSFPHVERFIPVQKKFTTHRAVVLHAGWLDQALTHCPIFLTAASRRSLVRVSVPVWGITLSGPLKIIDLVAHVFRTRAPLSRFRRISTARLACVRPPASVHPEPGSNSPLYVEKTEEEK
ncbi:hypothetical protein Lal_00009750 [Lupinus albus]|nr:hypothetical protein Lal_00009729 [Lupinus albus]KAF1853383.1 hypothetical protein Lal_00009750 [Lupinus albus]